MECYSGERDLKEQRWLWAASGELIEKTDLGGLSPRTAYWDADLQRELTRGKRIYSYQGDVRNTDVEGRLISVADIFGDWREELIMTLPGEMRIYTTTISAEDRRVCLMQDHLYRMDVAIQAMGYTQVPMTSTCFSSEGRE
jgi:rhamnogalacturonan endolyase